MKLNASKTQSLTVSRSRTVVPNHPDLVIDGIVLQTCMSFKILGILFDSKFTFEQHLRSVSSSVSQKIGLLRKSFKIFEDPSIVKKCFNSFILPCLEYCSPAWSSAADSHIKLLDRHVRSCQFWVPDLGVDLYHRRVVSSLCMLHKILHNNKHPLYSELPGSYQPVRNTRAAANVNSRAFTDIRPRTNQYERSFVPAATKLWNMLPTHVVEIRDLQKFKIKVNNFFKRRGLD